MAPRVGWLDPVLLDADTCAIVEKEAALVRTKRRIGWVAEWSNAHAWKACLPKGNQGSNPCPSATCTAVSNLIYWRRRPPCQYLKVLAKLHDAGTGQDAAKIRARDK